MSQMKPDGFDCISARQFAEAVLGELGYTCHTVGHVNHKIQAFVVDDSQPSGIFSFKIKTREIRFFIRC